MILSSVFFMFVVAIVAAGGRRRKSKAFEIEGLDISGIDTDSIERIIRVPELEYLQRRYSSQAQRATYIAHTLTSSQMLIGILLASSFVKSQLSETQLGWLGIAILVSSAAYASYRPDIVAYRVRNRNAICKRRIRQGENGAMLIRVRNSRIEDLLKLRESVAEWISDLETDEAQSWNLPREHYSQQKSSVAEAANPHQQDGIQQHLTREQKEVVTPGHPPTSLA